MQPLCLSDAVDAAYIPDVPVDAEACVDATLCFRVKLKQKCCGPRHASPRTDIECMLAYDL